eukprot:5645861-Pleurochrysis_carterae.AAC.2
MHAGFESLSDALASFSPRCSGFASGGAADVEPAAHLFFRSAAADAAMLAAAQARRSEARRRCARDPRLRARRTCARENGHFARKRTVERENGL